MNVWCVGRNYAEHAKELGNEVPSEPLIFLKAGSAVVHGAEIVLPAWAEDVHHELEIALRFGTDLRFDATALALDLTERAAQSRLKAKGQPWTLAKSFRGSCPMSAAIPFVPGPLRLRLDIDGELRQSGSDEQMIFSPEALREFVLARFPVEPGDWLLTGTPAGVGPIRPGQVLDAVLEDGSGRRLLRQSWQVRSPAGTGA